MKRKGLIKLSAFTKWMDGWIHYCNPLFQTIDACAFRSVLSSLFLTDMMYCTPASVQGVGVDFQIDRDFTSPQHCETYS
jgi:hypothetical protein